MESYGMYMDHGNPPVPATDFIAEYDASESHGVDMGAIFKTETGFLGVVISGCS
ncbi:MAG: hypothetical protein SWO11_22780 [Thermodesulfobacteriota bacterium]|nr:hypothetical protein [Thermodesulfobacteriota bacterium]